MTTKSNATITSRRFIFTALGLSLTAGIAVGVMAELGIEPSPWLMAIIGLALAGLLLAIRRR
jgi:MYXO-CTERM domain-containing protein